MRYRPLGKTGLTVSEVGFGCASYWGKTAFDERQAIALVHEAIDRGVTFFDTGSSYSGGNAEPRLGLALAQSPTRHSLVVATKAGSRNGRGGVYYDHSPAWIRQSVENSLRNLGVDSIQLLSLHGPQISNLTDELLTTLARLKESGKVQHFGTNNGNAATIRYIAAVPLFESVMTNYSIVQPERGAIVNDAAAAGVGVLAGMAAAGGLIGRRGVRSLQDIWYIARAWKNHRSEMRRARHLDFLNGEAGTVSIAWVLRNPNVSSAVFSTTRMEHLRQNLEAAERPIGRDIAERISAAQAAFG